MSRLGPGVLQTMILQELAGGNCATLDALAMKLGSSTKGVSAAAAKLFRRQYILRQPAGCYQLTPAGKAAVDSGEVISSGPIDADVTVLARAPTRGLRDRAWRSMRFRRQFTIYDVVTDAVDQEKDAINDIARYIRILKGVGYVADLARRLPGSLPGSNGYKQFRLVKDTGPRAPLHRSKLGIVHDFNTGEDIPCSTPS